uniref:RNA polymerase sigma-70 domain-containing protein n=1 Tax=Picocystis salinarum TaxID=88271 RepID=A0A7S3UBP1_9CHLO
MATAHATRSWLMDRKQGLEQLRNRPNEECASHGQGNEGGTVLVRRNKAHRVHTSKPNQRDVVLGNQGVRQCNRGAQKEAGMVRRKKARDRTRVGDGKNNANKLKLAHREEPKCCTSKEVRVAMSKEKEGELADKVKRLHELEDVRQRLRDENEGKQPDDETWAREAGAESVQQVLADVWDGLAARDELVSANIGLVWTIAKYYEPMTFLSFDDLVTEGCIGLLKAARKFDPTSKARFGTYAYNWVRMHVRRAMLGHTGIVRLPEYASREYHKAKKEASDLAKKWGRTPSEEEIASRVGMPVERLQRMRLLSGGKSLDTLFDVYKEEPVFKYGNVLDVEEDVLMCQDLDLVLSTLTPDEAAVIRMRFGLDDGVCRTLREVQQEMDVSHETVRKLEMRGLQAMRRPACHELLSGYAETFA